jgi:hypothetical protein
VVRAQHRQAALAFSQFRAAERAVEFCRVRAAGHNASISVQIKALELRFAAISIRPLAFSSAIAAAGVPAHWPALSTNPGLVHLFSPRETHEPFARPGRRADMLNRPLSLTAALSNRRERAARKNLRYVAMEL